MVEFGRLRGKGRIRVSIENHSERVPKKGRISVSTEKWKNPGEYYEKVESVRVLKTIPSEYRKKGRISVSTEKL